MRPALEQMIIIILWYSIQQILRIWILKKFGIEWIEIFDQYIFQLTYRLRLQMQKENSLKFQHRIQSPENKEFVSIQVLIFNQSKKISCQEFFSVSHIVNLSNVPEIKDSGFSSLMYKQNSMTIFHIFLYYCIKVEKCLQLKGLQHLYQSKLVDLYVSNGFYINIGRYAKLCSKCLGLQFEKCAHIIYYLVYGRLATNCYVNNLRLSVHPQQKARNEKQKSSISTSKMFSKREESKQNQESTSASFHPNEMYDELTEDLKNIFSTNTEKIKQIQQLNNTNKDINAWNNQDCLKNKNQSDSDKGLESRYYLNFFPNKVYNQEKSAILQSLQPSNRNCYKLLRKKKFNQDKIQRMLEITYYKDLQKENINSKHQVEPKILKEKGRYFANNIIKTNEKFKNTSFELDKVRSTISRGKKKLFGQSAYGNLTQVISENEKGQLQLFESPGKKQKHQNQSLLYEQFLEENRFVNLLRKEQKGIDKRKELQTLRQGQKETARRESRRQLFGSLANDDENNKNGAFHSQCRNRVFRYKNEYRKFMKVHLFKAQNE